MKALLSFLYLLTITHLSYATLEPARVKSVTALAAFKEQSTYTVLFTQNPKKAEELSRRITTQQSARTAVKNRMGAFSTFSLSLIPSQQDIDLRTEQEQSLIKQFSEATETLVQSRENIGKGDMDFIPPQAFGYSYRATAQPKAKKRETGGVLDQIFSGNTQSGSVASEVQNDPRFADALNYALPSTSNIYTSKPPEGFKGNILNPSHPMSDEELNRGSTLAGTTNQLHPGRSVQETGKTSKEGGQWVWRQEDEDTKSGLPVYKKGNMGGFGPHQ